jgi:hypothetical protein
MRKTTFSIGIRVSRALSALMAAAVLAVCAAAAFAAPGISSASGRGGETTPLKMRIPDEPATSGDVVLPEAPAK